MKNDMKYTNITDCLAFIEKNHTNFNGRDFFEASNLVIINVLITFRLVIKSIVILVLIYQEMPASKYLQNLLILTAQK